MSDIAIKIENLGKRYRYGGAAPLSSNLRSDITDWIRGIFSPRRNTEVHGVNVTSAPPAPSAVKIEPQGSQRFTEETPSASSASSAVKPFSSSVPSVVKPSSHPSLHEVHERHLNESPEYFWAIKDVNLEVRQGEVVGIIGRNGAGKSTLLKILSRITPPTTGKITYNGRIASLLEVGTGFHRELTGRENIFLNGSILGMKRAEITKKFDEIVAFAEVEKFIDTPVKFYSSGMYVRLAFAVAAHLDPEILVVDEVLAVGDAQFQQKCLGKMKEVAFGGRTVLFVSHNMPAVQSLCGRAILIEKGRVAQNGPSSDVTAAYLISQNAIRQDVVWENHHGRRHKCDPVITGASILDKDGNPTDKILLGSKFTIRIHLSPPRLFRAPILALAIENRMGQRIVGFDSTMNGNPLSSFSTPVSIDCTPENLYLTQGQYSIKLLFKDSLQEIDVIDDAFHFTVLPFDYFGTGIIPTDQQGVIVCRARWNLPASPEVKQRPSGHDH